MWNYLCLWLPIGPRWTFIWHWLAFLLLFGLAVKVSAEGDGLVHEHEVGGSCCSTLIPPREPSGTVCYTAYSLPCSFRTKTVNSEQNGTKKKKSERAPCNDSCHNRKRSGCNFFEFFWVWRNGPTRTYVTSNLRLLDHIQGRTTVRRTTLDEWSARRRGLYLTTHDNHNRQTSMPPAGFEPAIPTNGRPQTYALDRTTTGICSYF